MAKNATVYTYSHQTPLLNADGNSIANEREDMVRIMEHKIGNGVIAADDIPVIGSVFDEITLNGETEANLFADNVIDADGISKVWAVITPPDDGPKDLSSPVLNLPEIELTNNFGTLYEGSYDGFTQKGKYNIAIFARDKNGTLSIPKRTSVRQTAGPSYPSIDSALKMSIPCVDLGGVHYDLSLKYISNPQDPMSLIWTLELNSLLIKQNCRNSYASIGIDFNLTISKMEIGGRFYEMTFEKHYNLRDPFGYYWKLDIESVNLL